MDEVLRDALDLHFSKSRLGWHFTANTLFHSVGPTVDKILKTKNKVPAATPKGSTHTPLGPIKYLLRYFFTY